MNKSAWASLNAAIRISHRLWCRGAFGGDDLESGMIFRENVFETGCLFLG
jgi:hypothetical protein